MDLLVLGINHRSAVEVRERLAIGEHGLPDALAGLSQIPELTECALLSTCNRTEVYAVFTPEAGDAQAVLATYLAGLHGLSPREFEGHLYCYRDGAAAAHLFSVAGGIDSMILGEPDIQRQVKHAMEAAQRARCLGTVLNRLFQEALTLGKRARTETGIARGAFSVGAAAVELAKQIFGEKLSANPVLILGAGKMSELTARHLQANGAPAVLVANRTYEKAVQVAAQVGGEARRFDELPEALLTADIAVCSTAAPHPVITRNLVRDVMKARQNRPLYLIDIAVPRNVEPSVGDLYNVYLHNIDDLQGLVSGARQQRSADVARAREIVDAGVVDFLRWWRSLDVSPLVAAVRGRLASVREGEAARLRARLPGLTESEWKIVDSAMQSLTGKIAHPVTVALKETAGSETGSLERDTIRRAFGLTDEPPEAELRSRTAPGDEPAAEATP